ncbi:hypothetical protein [Phaffia rhodozyma]|uniref:Uncharacterized protein n=1 Tax=Phaffia rhodozyma TaxID=264483 RepID=A0A0F7SQ86_PHARH|nr:hypothetical protein [Phaffia rhodozyma]
MGHGRLDGQAWSNQAGLFVGSDLSDRNCSGRSVVRPVDGRGRKASGNCTVHAVNLDTPCGWPAGEEVSVTFARQPMVEIRQGSTGHNFRRGLIKRQGQS